MNLFKLSVFILLYFAARVAFAAPCETFQGYEIREKLCWNDNIKGWLKESCTNKKCEAYAFFQSSQQLKTNPRPYGGQNRAALLCHKLKLPVVILRDSSNNEQSFCQFNDLSLVDTNAIERHVK